MQIRRYLGDAAFVNQWEMVNLSNGFAVPRYFCWALKYDLPAVTWLVLYVHPNGIYGIWNLDQTSTYCISLI